jgi:Protein of unknown function (DUF732)
MLSHRFTAAVAAITLTGATVGLTALGFAGMASASSVDDAFLAQIQADGITPPSAERAISEAHKVCESLNQGHSSQQVYSEVAEATGLSTKGAKVFAVDAATAYCPQYVSRSV